MMGTNPKPAHAEDASYDGLKNVGIGQSSLSRDDFGDPRDLA